MAQNMFAAVPARNKPLVEFRAGRMVQRGKTVSPRTNKGTIQIVQSQDDGLIHFLWKDRTTGQVESDLTIFPGDATWKRVKQCTTGRVYILEFKEDRRLFFWLQEPSEDKDDENAVKINQYINNPPAAESAGTGFGELDQSQLMSMMGQSRRNAPSQAANQGAERTTSAPTTATSASTPARPPAGQISSEHLQNILSGLIVDQPAAPPASQSEDASLPAVLNAEAILPLLNDPLVQAQLLPLLPEGNRTREELQELLRSPQFQQAVSQFNSALQSGQLSQLMPLLGLPATAGGTQGGVGALLRAIQEQARNAGQAQEKKDEESKPESKEDKDKGDEMDESH